MRRLALCLALSGCVVQPLSEGERETLRLVVDRHQAWAPAHLEGEELIDAQRDGQYLALVLKDMEERE